jgi:hypothetical protein
MNQSIYLMIGVPYLTLAVGAFLVYRGCKKNAAYRQALAEAHPAKGADHVQPSSA